MLHTITGWTLLRRFTLASLLMAAGFAVTLAWLIGGEVERAAVNEAVMSTAQAADSLLKPYLVSGDFTFPLWAGRLDDLDRLVSRHLSDKGIVRVKLWSRRGTVIYSNHRGVIGTRSIASGELAAALRGRVAAILGAPDPDPIERGAMTAVLRVYVPMRLPGASQIQGAYEVHRNAGPLLAQIRAARTRAWLMVVTGIAVLYGALFGMVRGASRTLVNQQRRLQDAFDGVIQSLAAAVDAKDAYTGGHSSLVSRYAEAIAKAIGLPADEVQVVRMAGHLHDLGKIGIPDRVLRKAARLSDREWETISRHSVIGYQILRPVPIDERIKLAVRHSHERWDGTGYPDGLAEEEIPVHARILLIADAYDAMTSDRPYRVSLGVERAARELRRKSGTQFDPRLVEVFLKWLETPEVQSSLEPIRAEG